MTHSTRVGVTYTGHPVGKSTIISSPCSTLIKTSYLTFLSLAALSQGRPGFPLRFFA